MTSHLDSHTTTDVNPDIPHDRYNIRGVAHACTNRKDDIFMQKINENYPEPKFIFNKKVGPPTHPFSLYTAPPPPQKNNMPMMELHTALTLSLLCAIFILYSVRNIFLMTY